MSKENETLNQLAQLNSDFQSQVSEELKSNAKNEFSLEKLDNMPELSKDLELEANYEIDQKINLSVQEFDVKPKAIYYNLLTEQELKPDITKKELTISAYEFLIKHSKNKLIKKLAQQLKKEVQ